MDDYIFELAKKMIASTVDEATTLIENNYKYLQYNDNFLLRSACLNERLDLVQMLVEKGADFSQGNQNAFITSAYQGKIDLVNYFISLGVSTENYIHALQGACYYSHLEVVQKLLHCGIPIDSSTYQALRYATINSHIAVVEALLDYGFDVGYAQSFAQLNQNKPIFQWLENYIKTKQLKEYFDEAIPMKHDNYCNKLKI